MVYMHNVNFHLLQHVCCIDKHNFDENLWKQLLKGLSAKEQEKTPKWYLRNHLNKLIFAALH